MHAFFFGDSNHPLYGVSHSPSGSNFQNTAILILNPVGHEYIRSHKALRLLADNLARAGYFVLRFDYQATGDSSGNLLETSLEDWQSDIVMAADELRSISGQSDITAIGLRLGASLAFMSQQEAKLNSIYAWDPVISGKAYLANLLNLQTDLLANKNSWFISPVNSSELIQNEYLGYQYSASWIESIEKLDLLSETLPKRLRLKTLNTQTDDLHRQFNAKCEDELKRFTSFEIDDMGDWQDIMKIDNALLVHKITQKIIEELS